MNIYQSFKLDLEAITEKKDKIPSGAANKLKAELRNRGYDFILENMNSFCGVPETIIVASREGEFVKRDFYEITERLNLSYKSGDFYIEAPK